MSTVASTPRDRRIDRGIAALLAMLTLFWLLGTEGKQGIGRDEAQYMRAAERYWGWFAHLTDNIKSGHIRSSFTRSGLDAYWSDNAPDHPVVMKILYGVSWRLFHGKEAEVGRSYHPLAYELDHGTIPIFRRPTTAFRFPAMLMAGLLAALVFFLAREFLPRTPSVFAAVLAVAQPHYFFHAPLACFDAPVTTMAVAVGLCYWKALRSPRWGVIAGIVFGIALGVKHNAWLMPIFLCGHYIWMHGDRVLRFRLPPIPLAFVAMLVAGPLLFVAHWPWIWVSPIARAQIYVMRHVQHEHYNFEYLGRNWNLPPTEIGDQLVRATFPWVSTALTVPVTTLLLAVVGAVILIRRCKDKASESEQTPELTPSWKTPGRGIDRAKGAYFAVQVLGPMAVLTVPSTPIFGGVKHFMPAAPYLAIVAAMGAHWAWSVLNTTLVPRVAARWHRVVPILPVAFVALLALPAVSETQRSHPDGLSHYNLIAGGFAGGASIGMNRQFWGYSVLPLLGSMAKNTPSRRNVYWHDVMGDALNLYIRDGRLPPGMGNTGVGEDAIRYSDMGIIVHELHMNLYEAVFWDNYRTVQPTWVRTREGVPIVTGYKRPGAPFLDLTTP
jgi:Dolichyl-phosphate-mannose-protein mannosyltransferase